MARLWILAAVVAFAAAACGGGATRNYSAEHTAACLRDRPEFHRPSSLEPLTELTVVRRPAGSDGIWVQSDPHVTQLFLTFAPFRGRSTPPDEGPNYSYASFFGNQAAEDMYFRAALHNVRKTYPSPPWRLNQFVEQRGNVVIEWGEYVHPDYSRVVLACLST